MVICLERGADLHMAQLMPLPLIVSCFSKIQTGFTFLVPAHPGSPGQRADKRVCVCVLYPQNSDRIVTIDSVTSFHPVCTTSYRWISAASSQAAASGRHQSTAGKQRTSSMLLLLSIDGTDRRTHGHYIACGPRQ